MPKFNVTYEIVTQESAEHGDAAERGFLGEDLSLREAIDLFDHEAGMVEANCYPIAGYRWLTVHESSPITGETENRSLHIPDIVTESTKIRIARLLNCYGVQSV